MIRLRIIKGAVNPTGDSEGNHREGKDPAIRLWFSRVAGAWPCQALPRPSFSPPAKMTLVGRGGLEPPTSRLSGVRSNHLSYRPKLILPAGKYRRAGGPLVLSEEI
uniref:Uncharacterized protein n=1 Tax=uncultured Rhodobacterales bacterium HF4000_03E16 TaxID=710785 RepID=E0XV88_9RHOB|nr:hypothetical protein [uncultured Rhodobacterales bacterium HF4000_03E16]